VVERLVETQMPEWGVQVLPPEPETLAQRIRAKRTQLGMSQEECAAAVGTGQNQWSYWERGDYFPRKTTLRQIAQLLEEPYEALLALLNADEERRDQARTRTGEPKPRRDKPAILVYPAEPRVAQALRILGQLEHLPDGDKLAEHWVRWAEQHLAVDPGDGTNVPDPVSDGRRVVKSP
jgi:transcriptional regulator with XRE-family HTH domain